MCKSFIYHALVILLLSLMPTTGMAQQATDINKPTRTRTTEKKQKSPTTGNNKNNDKAVQEKPAATPVTDKKGEPQAVKAAEAKKGDTAAKPDSNKPVTDTTGKAAPQPKPKPKRVPVDPDKVQFDGIDVSKHQGVINWEELRKNSKIQFVYIKATEGSNHVDARYKQNFAAARKHGFKVGSYHYFTDLSSARMQFQNFINIVNPEEQDLLPVIDVEKRDRWTPQQLRDSVKVFADLIEDYYGVKPVIYTFETFFNRNLGLAFDKYPIFIAKYPKGQEQPNINGVKWILWQFSESGKFAGVKDNLVDMSRFNKGCSINDILYKPSKHKPKNTSVKDAVDHKDKPTTVKMTDQTPKPTKQQQEDAKKQAEKEKKAKERNKKLAEEDAKKKAEADKKAKEKAEQKAEQQKREKARQAAEAKKAAEAKAKKDAELKAKKEAEAKAKAEADAKAKRKAEAQKARQQKAQQSSSKTSKSSSLMSNTASKLSQSQRNDSIRTAKQQGRKTNKSSADND